MPATLPWPKIAQHAGEDRQLLAVDHGHLLRQKPHQRLRHRQAHRLAVIVFPSRRASVSAVECLPPRLPVMPPAAFPDDSQRSTSAPNFAAMSSIASSSSISPASQRSRRLGEDGAADGKALARSRPLERRRNRPSAPRCGASRPSSTTPRQSGSRAAITASIACQAATDACGSSFHQSGLRPAS